MPIATLRYKLPDEQADFDAAMLARKMASALWDIDQACRTVVKYEQTPSDDRLRLAEEIRQIITDECGDALDL